MSQKSTDFSFLITLSSMIGSMAKVELEKKGIPVKTTSSGTNISWNEIRAGASSPEVFMPAIPIDIYVPGNRFKESKKILQSFGWDKEDIEKFEPKKWQKIWAIILLLIYLIFVTNMIISSLR